MIHQPRILWLFSAPLVALDGTPLDALDMDAERNAIVHELSECKKAALLHIGYATVDELAKCAEKFNILHLSSHGHEEFLLFEDGKGGSQPVTGDYLKKLISMGKPFELAIVSACHSEKIGALLVEAGIPHVVAVKHDTSVVDHAAIIFTCQFLRSLLKGDSVKKAFEIAKLLVEGSPDLIKIKGRLKLSASTKGEEFLPEEKKFVLLPQGGSHSNPLLRVPQGALIIEEPPPCPSTLPVKPQSFTGRSVEMHDLITELVTNRVVTITGAGGIGKTTVAIEVARWSWMRTMFRDGVYYVNLRQTDTADGMIDLFSATFGVQFSELKDVLDYLQQRRCLLLLDNAEDILWQDEDAMQALIDSILKFTRVKLLITSQRPIGGNLHEPEHIYRMYPLERDDAGLLFLVTAKRRMTEEEWKSDTFDNLLEHLGGHPLSIVLIARQLVPGVLVEDLNKKVEVYKAKAIKVKDITDKDVEHGESLVASLASAYDSLTAAARTLLGVLSLLPAGSREGMLTDIFGNTAWEYVQELNEASLVEIRERRATLLPPVRLFAMNAAEGIREDYGPAIVEVLAKYTTDLYEHHSKRNAKEYRLWFTIDEPNLRSAVDLPCTPSQTVHERSALGILGPRLIFLYFYHNRWKEAKEVGNKILSHLGRVHDQLGEADTLLVMGVLAVRSGDLGDARSKYEKASHIYQHTGYERGEVNALWELGDLAVQSGALGDARSKYERALKICQTIQEKLAEANIFMRLGILAALSGNHGEAQSKYETALTIYQTTDEKLGEANTFKYSGDLALQTGRLEDARSKYETALTIYRTIEEKEGEASTLVRLGQWAALKDRIDDAETYLEAASTLLRETRDSEGQAEAHMVRALVFLRQNDIAKAQNELDCCSSIRDRIYSHCKTVQWLILYTHHLRLHGFQEGAKLCSEYAVRFASKSQDHDFRDQVMQQLRNDL